MKNKPLPAPRPVAAAPRAEVDRFLKGLQRFRAKGFDEDASVDEDEVKKYDQTGVKTYLDKMSVGSQQGIARRIMMDILKSATTETTDRAGKRTSIRRRPTKKTALKVKSKRISRKKRSPAKKKKKAKRRT